MEKKKKATTKETKPTIEEIKQAIAMGMEPMAAIEASVSEIEAFHKAEERRLQTVAKEQKARQEKRERLLKSLDKLQQEHSGFTMSEKISSAIIAEYVLSERALPESGQRQEYKENVEVFLSEVYGQERKAWDGNRALLASGAMSAIRLVIHLLQDGLLSEKQLKENQLHFTGSKMKRK